MAGLGDQMAAAAAGRGEVWVPPPAREVAIEALKAAFVQGRLGKDEFDARIGHALAAPTYADLAPAIADLPARPTAARPLRKPAGVQPRRPVNRGVKWGACGLITPALLAPAAVVVLSASNAVERWTAIETWTALVSWSFAFLYFVLWLLFGAGLLWEWYDGG